MEATERFGSSPVLSDTPRRLRSEAAERRVVDGFRLAVRDGHSQHSSHCPSALTPFTPSTL